MTAALNLYKRKTMDELTAMQVAIHNDPVSRMPPGSGIYLYTPKARKKLQDIAWAITYHLSDKKSDHPAPSGFNHQ